jgi:hypothetical protein
VSRSCGRIPIEPGRIRHLQRYDPCGSPGGFPDGDRHLPLEKLPRSGVVDRGDAVAFTIENRQNSDVVRHREKLETCGRFRGSIEYMSQPVES